MILGRDLKAGTINKVPQDIQTTRDLTTRYLEQKMPSTDSWLYKKTGFLDRPAWQKVVKADQKALDEVGKLAPTATSAGALVRDLKSYDLNKVPADIKQTQAATTDYFTKKMSSPNSLLYRATNILDSRVGQIAVKGAQNVLDAAPAVLQSGNLVRDLWKGNSGQVGQDIKQTQAAMTDYLTKKMPTTDSWLYKNTNFLDQPGWQKTVRGAQNALDATPTAANSIVLAKDIATLRVDKLAGDIKNTRAAMTDYFSANLPPDNWAYKALDTRAGQAAVKVSEGVLNATSKASEAASSVIQTVERFASFL